VAGGQPYEYRASRWWPAIVLAPGALVAISIAGIVTGRGSWTSAAWGVAALPWCGRWVLSAFAVTVDGEAGTIELRKPLWRRRRRLADLQGVQRGSGNVHLTFERARENLWSGPDAAELIGRLESLCPAVRDPAVRPFTIVTWGYERAQVDDHRRRLRRVRDGKLPPGKLGDVKLPLSVRGYDRGEVDAALAEIEAAIVSRG
jgi:DivIVA domain-containing protein